MNKINIGSFISSFVCIFLFYIVSFSDHIDFSVLNFHPLNLVLIITLITLVFGVLGFAGIRNWKGMAMSVTTVILTLGLSTFLAFFLFVGNLLS